METKGEKMTESDDLVTCLFGLALGVQVETDHGKLGKDEGQRKVLAERHGEFDPRDLDPEKD